MKTPSWPLSKIAIAIAIAAPNLHAKDLSAQDEEIKTSQTKIDETMVVQGRAQQFYLETDTKVGTKTEMDIMDIPQTVQVITSELMEDQAARSVTDLYRSIPGVSNAKYSTVMFRGFLQNDAFLYDGHRGDPYSGFSVPSLHNIERVEVLSGPAGALYGSGEPGGVINYVTKQADFADTGKVSIYTGSEYRRGASVEKTGAASDNVAYRFSGYFEEADSFRNNADQADADVTLNLLFDITDSTRLYTTAQYIKQNLGGNRLRGVRVDEDGNFLTDIRFNAAEATDYLNTEAYVAQARLEHEFNQDLKLNVSGRYYSSEQNERYHEPGNWECRDQGPLGCREPGGPEYGDIERQIRQSHDKKTQYSIAADLTYQLSNHTLLFGTDMRRTDWQRMFGRADGSSINIYDPIYGNDNADMHIEMTPNTDAQSDRYSFYVQDYVELGDYWGLLVGTRYDHFKETNPLYITSDGSAYEYDDGALTSRVGVTFKPWHDHTFYANYSESFKPQALLDQGQNDLLGGDVLEPEKGHQYEVGLKSMWLDESIMTTVAAYNIVKKNVATPDPDGNGWFDKYVALGKVESKGVEFLISGDITQYWAINANYAYNDTVVVEGDLSNTVGDGTQFHNSPNHQAGLWNRFALDRLDSAFSFGMKYVGDRYDQSYNKMKAYTIWDASWHYTPTKVDTIRLNVQNIFDAEYAESVIRRQEAKCRGLRVQYI